MLTLIIFSILATTKAAILPQLTCSHIRPNFCRLSNVYLLHDQPKYKLIAEAPEKINDAQVLASKLTVLSADFCETFPNLESLDALTQGVEVVAADAFHSCYNLQVLSLGRNAIQVLPEGLLKNAYQLRQLQFGANSIGVFWQKS